VAGHSLLGLRNSKPTRQVVRLWFTADSDSPIAALMSTRGRNEFGRAGRPYETFRSLNDRLAQSFVPSLLQRLDSGRRRLHLPRAMCTFRAVVRVYFAPHVGQ
jgi:hypothetical protein